LTDWMVFDLAYDRAYLAPMGMCQPGAVNLSRALEAAWPILYNREGVYGCYNYRPITGTTNTVSKHNGEALDVGIGWTPTDAQRAALYECTRELAQAARYLGVQMIIYNRELWKPNRSPEWQSYDTGNGGSHVDHAHVELTHEGAQLLSFEQASHFIPPLVPKLPPYVPPTPVYFESEDDVADMPAFRYRDSRYANVFIVFPNGNVITVSARALSQYAALPEVVDAHDQMLASLMSKSGITQQHLVAA